MKKIFLVTVLIEYSAESVTDAHYAYADYNKAREAMSVQIEEARENFSDEAGEFIVDVDTSQEWRNEDGYGYTVGIEEHTIEE